jgi:hypothetical protein
MTAANMSEEQVQNNDHLVTSLDPQHPANLIPSLCRQFYSLGWYFRQPPFALPTSLTQL